ncbi:hypothetical protein DSCOOX_39050 [Desulfosarcina ovata subsp. ovata]|uniref:Phenol degradation protein meta n=2 Tax=Desulfosarcina ovata TaxID=83564 RepID=A0A5K8ADN4_9BACT|nr:hypothetical protein DSCOOX_39050 [Desulfosarcina ovata subsp. ovata]
MALLGAPGWYMRNDLSFASSDINAVIIGDTVYAAAEQDVWVNTIKGIYLAAGGLLGGRFGAALSVPVVLDASLSADLALRQMSKDGSKTGLADINVTAFNNWTTGNFHFSAGMTLFAPTGAYDETRLINLGRNYWTFDFMLASTFLDPKRGHELSYTLGYMVNTENPDTDYRSGDELHLDVHIAQHFSSRFAVGLDGYCYRQTTDDSGPLLDYANTVLPMIGAKPLDGNRGEAYGIGPVIKYTAQAWSRDISLIAKWLHDLDTEHRFEGDTVMFSVALKF